MAHPSRALLWRLARLLEPPHIDDVNDTLLSAALSPGCSQLTPLIRLVERDVADHFAHAFAPRPDLDDRKRVVAILREMTEHERTHDHDCRCAERAASLAPFARALMGLSDPFYRGVGEILLRDVVEAVGSQKVAAPPMARTDLAKADQPEISA